MLRETDRRQVRVSREQVDDEFDYRQGEVGRRFGTYSSCLLVFAWYILMSLPVRRVDSSGVC